MIDLFKENNGIKINELKIEKPEEIECNNCKCCNFLNKKKYRDLKNFNENSAQILNTDPYLNNLKINFCFDLIKDSYSTDTGLENIFIVFKSIDDIFYIIYANNKQSIILFNFVDNKKINEIKEAHNYYINNFRHYLDKINKRDLIISISSFDNNIKLWNINNLECIVNINAYEIGEMYSACFLYSNKELYIVSCNDYYPDKPDSIKIFNLKGKKIKEISNSNERSFFIDTYYDNKYDKNYILVGNKNYVKSYDYYHNKLYRKYCDESIHYHCSIIIDIPNNNSNIIKLIESSCDGNIRIWNFHSGELIKKIEVISKREYMLYGMCLWNNDYIFVGCSDKSVKLVDINSGKILQYLTGFSDFVLTVKIIKHPFYGECLITKGGEYDMIKLWTIKK